MPRILQTVTARRDLVRLRAFLHGKDPEATSRLVPTVIKAIERLENFPQSAPVSEMPPVRLLRVPFGQSGYTVAYTYQDDTILILRIKHDIEDDFPVTSVSFPQ